MKSVNDRSMLSCPSGSAVPLSGCSYCPRFPSDFSDLICVFPGRGVCSAFTHTGLRTALLFYPCESYGVLRLGAISMFAHMDPPNRLNSVASVDISAIFIFIFRLSPHTYGFVSCFTITNRIK